MTKQKSIALCGLMAIGLAVSPVMAFIETGQQGVVHAETQASDEAVKSFVSEASGQVIQILNMSDKSINTRRHAFKAIFEQYADVGRIASFVGGRGWKEASDKQKQAFVDTFSDYMAFTYAKRFENYQGETVGINRITQAGKKGIIIQTRINRPAGAPPVLVDWQVKPEGDTFKVLDLVVEQVSMSMTQRAEFQAILEKNSNSLENLRQELEKRLPSA